MSCISLAGAMNAQGFIKTGGFKRMGKMFAALVKRYSRVLAVGFCTAAVVIIFYGFQVYVWQPMKFIEHLGAVIRNEQPLTKVDIDAVAMKAEASGMIYAGLQQDLTPTRLADASAGAQLLLPQAVAFLDDETQLLAWVSEQLQSSPWAQEPLVQRRKSLTSIYLIATEGCLLLERQRGRWRLASLLSCQPAASGS